MPSLSVMIKPASSLCNMRCEYCFYHSLSQAREKYSYGVMSESTALSIIQKATEFADGAPLHFAFQGGEPTVAGLDFFRFFVKTVKETETKSQTSFSLQTNGLLIDNEWAKFFAENKFLIGLSLDGDLESNQYRVDADGKSTTERVIRASEILDAHGVPFNILSVVTKKSLERLDSIFDFYEKHNFKYLQFIPCLKSFGVESAPYAMNEEEFSTFLIGAWKKYERAFYERKPLSIRFFDNLLMMAMGNRAEQCGLYGRCGIQSIIEANGDVFPCDFYCLDEWKLGNINEISFREIGTCERAGKFIAESLPVRQECKSCDYYKVCLGGCKRYLSDLDYCKVMKTFFKEVYPSLQKIATNIKQMKSPTLQNC
ncbi:MAG: SPASM domain-containing protein [Clostridiales bacterium]|nr:SPASM domain-containing protein [Clostridiales bacterium]